MLFGAARVYTVAVPGQKRKSWFISESRDQIKVDLEEGSDLLDGRNQDLVSSDGDQSQGVSEEALYTGDVVRVYLREMGAVPLLTRQRESQATAATATTSEVTALWISAWSGVILDLE